MEHHLKCDLQLIKNSFDLDAGEWTQMAKDCTGGEKITCSLESKETANFLNGVIDRERWRHDDGQGVLGYEHGDGQGVQVRI